MSKRLDIHKVIGLLLCMLFVACQQEEVDSPLVEASEAISFHVIQPEEDVASRSTDSYYGELVGNKVLRSDVSADTLAMGVYVSDMSENTSLSRGVPVTSDNLASLSVWASKQEEGKNIQSFFKNLKVSKNGSGSFESENTYYWPGAIFTLGFTAVSPYNPQGLQVVMDGNNIMPSSFVYEVPSAAEAQSDLMISTPRAYNGNEKTPVQLHFRHLCSAVNVKVGTIPQGSIEAITFKNIFNKGTYTLASNTWSVTQGAKADFAVDFVGTSTNYPTAGTETGNPQINDAGATFMMIPQTLPDDAEIEITFLHGNTNRRETLQASLKGTEWIISQTNNYLISITPDCKLEFTTEIETQDAHYVICKVPFRVTNLPEGGEWEMAVSAKDGNTQVDVTLQRAFEVNAFAKQGFWTDKVMVGDNVTNESARGTNTITGTIDTDGVDTAYVFLPENITESTREITLTLSQKGKDNLVSKTILQVSPKWTGDYGWENVDDDEAGPYGFCWTRKVAYIFPYNLGRFGKYTEDEARALINALITQYNALSYASIVEYSPGFLQTRVYIWLDYTKLNNLSVANSSSDGFANTLALESLGGSATSSAFEEALKNTKKTEEGKEGENMFRLKNGDNNVPDAEGENNVSSGIMNYVMKKNRYYLRKTQESSVGTTTTAPYIQRLDIVWYLPAYGQFSSNTSINVADYWSSTAADGGTEAYLGNGTKADRTSIHKVIAVRKKP